MIVIICSITKQQSKQDSTLKVLSLFTKAVHLTESLGCQVKDLQHIQDTKSWQKDGKENLQNQKCQKQKYRQQPPSLQQDAKLVISYYFFFGYKAIYSRGRLAQSGERSLTNPAIRGRFTAKPNA